VKANTVVKPGARVVRASLEDSGEGFVGGVYWEPPSGDDENLDMSLRLSAFTFNQFNSIQFPNKNFRWIYFVLV
jgi:hypothetical protein